MTRSRLPSSRSMRSATPLSGTRVRRRPERELALEPYSSHRSRTGAGRDASSPSTTSTMPIEAAEPNSRARSSSASASEKRASIGSATSSNSARASSMRSTVIVPSPRASHASKKRWNTSWMNLPRARGESVGSSSGGSSSLQHVGREELERAILVAFEGAERVGRHG